MLATRLKKVVGLVVSKAQNAFVEGRQITNASLIANEVIDYLHKRKVKGVVCKLDIEKAFDSINWLFLLKVMQCMGFGPKWVRWIWWCIATTRFLILINGIPMSFFPSSRGLRQGDPISPYLFIMGMEVLSIMLKRAVTGGYSSSCNFRGSERNDLSISHLLFADDTIIFCEAKEDQLLHLSWILLWFEASSGLKINLDKSELIPVGNVVKLNALDVELGCRTGYLPSTYLGLPLGTSHKSMAVWDSVEERMRKRLALWNRNYISKGWRVTLIKSTLASLPLYQMSLIRMPAIVTKRLEKLQGNFLWGGGALEKKTHLVKWKVVCSEKGMGGLGLRNLTLLNKALFGKWIWRFGLDPNCTWKRLMSFKYGVDGLC